MVKLERASSIYVQIIGYCCLKKTLQQNVRISSLRVDWQSVLSASLFYSTERPSDFHFSNSSHWNSCFGRGSVLFL